MGTHDSENRWLCFQVHPNPKRPPDLKLKLYEFAGKIVGKCLFESSLGRPYRQLVKARFSKSFLAQLMGLRVNYKVSFILFCFLCHGTQSSCVLPGLAHGSVGQLQGQAYFWFSASWGTVVLHPSCSARESTGQLQSGACFVSLFCFRVLFPCFVSLFCFLRPHAFIVA